ncbi:MAG: trigger factor [Anaerovoracaceae bacterium]
MRKRICTALLCGVLAVGMTSCGSSMSYDDYELKDYIKVGEYKGLTAAPYTISVTDDEVDAQIQTNLESAATDEKLDKNTAVADGDTVNIDYTGKVGGKEFDGGSAEGYDLTIGSGSFIDGFESGLIGKKIGEKTELNLTFPDDYSDEDLAGKAVVFSVKINSATRKSIPELNADFVKNNTEYETVDEYTKAVEKQLYDDKEIEAVNEQKTELWSQALDNTEVKKYPERELEHYIEFNSEQIDKTAKSYGMSREDVLSQYEFGDEEEFAAVNEDSSKLRVKQEMLIEYIAAKEKLSYTDEEKQQLIENFQAQGFDNESIEEQTGRSMGDYVHIELLYGKVLDLLLENAKIEGAATSK